MQELRLESFESLETFVSGCAKFCKTDSSTNWGVNLYQNFRDAIFTVPPNSQSCKSQKSCTLYKIFEKSCTCTRFFLNSAQGPIGIAGGAAGWSESKEIDSLMIPDRDLWCAGFRSAAVVDFEKNLVH